MVGFFFKYNFRMNYGFIKLHRSLLEWQYWSDHNTTRLLIYLLVAVNFEDKKWNGIDVKKGSLITSLDSLSRETGLSTKQLRRCLKILIKDGQIIQKTTNKYQSLTLVKWDELQLEDVVEGKQRANKGQTKDKQRATTKESKESNNEINNNSNKLELINKRKIEFQNLLFPFVPTYGKDMMNDFFKYWTEPNQTNTKMRFEMQKTWSTELRLTTWAKNNKNYNNNQNGKPNSTPINRDQQIAEYTARVLAGNKQSTDSEGPNSNGENGNNDFATFEIV